MQTATSANARQLSVLIVDDNGDAANSLAFAIGDVGCDVTTCYDGDEAVRLLDAMHFDVVLCDIGLPGRSGYEVAEHVRSSPGLRPLLVAVSGYSSPSVVHNAWRAGFHHFFAKPADPAAIEGLLRQHAERQNDSRRTDFVPVDPI